MILVQTTLQGLLQESTSLYLLSQVEVFGSDAGFPEWMFRLSLLNCNIEQQDQPEGPPSSTASS